uniref:Uncharacterized protein n=1 Tax=Fundulus heteroclitus TaxID=8078 RepID=A0A3Q2QV13_FUNHE
AQLSSPFSPRTVLLNLTHWSSGNNLILNTRETKEVMIDYRTCRRTEHLLSTYRGRWWSTWTASGSWTFTSPPTSLASESIETKASLLKANPSLIAGVLSGLVEVGGSANYLNDKKEFKNQSRVILQYKATSAFQRLDMSHHDAKKQQIKYVFKNSLATHVVTGILYGANAFFVFDSEKLESHSLRSMEASMQSLIKKIPKLDPDENTVKKLREEKNVMEKVSCKFYGDFILGKNPTTFEEAVGAYRKLPGLLGTNGEKSVPVRVWLTPLKNLDPAAAELKADLSDGLLRKIENVLEALRETEMRCNDIMENEVAKTLPHIYKKLKSFQHICEKYRKTVQQTLQEKIPPIRAGEKEDSLENFLDVQENSPFSQNNLNTWLDNLVREINVIASCLAMMKGIKIITEKSDLDRQVLGMEEVLCFVFTSTETNDPFMDQMVDYLKETPTSITPPAKDQWFYSAEVLENIKQKANMMSETAKSLGTSRRFSFLVAALPDEEFIGATIYHYRRGVLKTRDFSKPAIHRVRNITDKQDLILILT